MPLERILTTAALLGAKYYLNKALAPKSPSRSSVQQQQSAAPQATNTRRVLQAGDRYADYVLGRKRVTGYQFFEQDVDDDQTRWQAFAISEGACDTIEKVWINGEDVPFTRSGTRLVFGEDYAERIDIYQYFAGDGSQGAEIRAACDQFTTAYLGEQISWVAVRLNQPNFGDDDKERFWEDTPELSFLVRGMRITWPGQTSARWTNNAIAIRGWFETQVVGLPEATIDLTTFRAAYNIAEQSAAFSLPSDLADYTRTFTRRYTFDDIINITPDTNIQDIREALDFACQGYVAEDLGKLYFYAGADRTVLYDITEEHLVSIPDRKDWPAVEDRINGITMNLSQSLDHEYLDYDLPTVVDEPAQMRDNNPGVADLGQVLGINSPVKAAWLATIALRNTRASLRIIINVFPEFGSDPFAFTTIKPGEWVTLTIARFQFNQKLFSVFSRQRNGDGSVSLLLEEQTLGNFALTFDLPPLRSRLGPTIDYRQVPALTGLALEEYADRQKDGTVIIRHEATWDSRSYRTEIEQRVQGTTDATPQSIETGSKLSFEPVRAGQTYEYRGRHFNASGIYGEWSAWVADTVDGDLTPPANPTGVTFTAIPENWRVKWTPSTDNDYKHTIIYVSNDPNVRFSESFRIDVTDADYFDGPSYSEVTAVRVWVRHVDFSGNRSGVVSVTGSTGKVAAMNVPLGPSLEPNDDGLIDLIPSLLDLIFGNRGEELVLPTVTLTDIDSVNAGGSVLIRAMIEGGNYDEIEVSYEIESGVGTLDPVSE